MKLSEVLDIITPLCPAVGGREFAMDNGDVWWGGFSYKDVDSSAFELNLKDSHGEVSGLHVFGKVGAKPGSSGENLMIVELIMFDGLEIDVKDLEIE